MPKPSHLPTAARLVAAALLSVAAIIFVPILMNAYPEENTWKYHETSFKYMLIAIGIHVGWNGLGIKVNTDQGSGIGLGLRAAITMTVWALGLLAIWHGIEKMKKHAYYEPVPAVLDMFNQLAEYSTYLLNVKLLLIIAAMGIVAGLLTENAGKRWR